MCERSLHPNQRAVAVEDVLALHQRAHLRERDPVGASDQLAGVASCHLLTQQPKRIGLHLRAARLPVAHATRRVVEPP